MRSTFMLAVAFVAAMTAFAVPSQSADTDAALPERKAGMWELKTTMDEGNGPIDQTMKICIDESMEKNTVIASVAEHKTNCETYTINSANGATTVEADCMFNKRKVVSTTTMSGDFKAAFDIKIVSKTTDPSDKAQSIVINRTITQTGKYLGESCGDLKGGQAQGPDGNPVMVQ